MSITTAELEELQSIRGRIRRSEQFIELLRSDAETLRDCKFYDQIVAKTQSCIHEYEIRIHELQGQRREIIGKITELPDRQSKILLLRYDAGMTWQQVADAMAMTPRNVYRLRRLSLDKRTACTSDSEGRSAAD